MERRTTRLMEQRKKAVQVKLSKLNPFLTCPLCNGYYIDATTIVECIHSFCRACIVKYLETNKFCPVCDVQVHKAQPLLSIRSDLLLQSLVYKLVPGLLTKEMNSKKDFFTKGDRLYDGRCDGKFSSENSDLISVSLEYCFRFSFDDDGKYQQSDCLETRYLLCPPGFTVGCLKKFIRKKFDLPFAYEISILCENHLLDDDYSLYDIISAFYWLKNSPLRLCYSIFRTFNRKRKSSDSFATEDAAEDATASIEASSSIGFTNEKPDIARDCNSGSVQHNTMPCSVVPLCPELKNLTPAFELNYEAQPGFSVLDSMNSDTKLCPLGNCDISDKSDIVGSITLLDESANVWKPDSKSGNIFCRDVTEVGCSGEFLGSSSFNVGEFQESFGTLKFDDVNVANKTANPDDLLIWVDESGCRRVFAKPSTRFHEVAKPVCPDFSETALPAPPCLMALDAQNNAPFVDNSVNNFSSSLLFVPTAEHLFNYFGQSNAVIEKSVALGNNIDHCGCTESGQSDGGFVPDKKNIAYVIPTPFQGIGTASNFCRNSDPHDQNVCEPMVGELNEPNFCLPIVPSCGINRDVSEQIVDPQNSNERNLFVHQETEQNVDPREQSVCEHLSNGTATAAQLNVVIPCDHQNMEQPPAVTTLDNESGGPSNNEISERYEENFFIGIDEYVNSINPSENAFVSSQSSTIYPESSPPIEKPMRDTSIGYASTSDDVFVHSTRCSSIDVHMDIVVDSKEGEDEEGEDNRSCGYTVEQDVLADNSSKSSACWTSEEEPIEVADEQYCTATATMVSSDGAVLEPFSGGEEPDRNTTTLIGDDELEAQTDNLKFPDGRETNLDHDGENGDMVYSEMRESFENNDDILFDESSSEVRAGTNLRHSTGELCSNEFVINTGDLIQDGSAACQKANDDLLLDALCSKSSTLEYSLSISCPGQSTSSSESPSTIIVVSVTPSILSVAKVPSSHAGTIQSSSAIAPQNSVDVSFTDGGGVSSLDMSTGENCTNKQNSVLSTEDQIVRVEFSEETGSDEPV